MSQQLVESAVMCHMAFLEFFFILGKHETQKKEHLEPITSEAHRRLRQGACCESGCPSGLTSGKQE